MCSNEMPGGHESQVLGLQHARCDSGSVLGWRAPMVFGAALLAVYLLTASGQMRSWDGQTMLAAARAMAHRGSWALQPEEARGLFGVVTGRGLQSMFAPGYQVALVPAAMVGDGLARLSPAHRRELGEFACSWVNAIFTAATGGLLWHCLRLFGHGQRRATVLSAAYALGSPAFVYAKWAGSEALCMFFVTLALHGTLGWKRDGDRRCCIEAILGAVGAMLTRYPAAVLFPLIAGQLLYCAPTGRRGVVALAVTAGALLAVGTVAWDNSVRFGSPLTTGYTLYGQAEGNNRLLLSGEAIARGVGQATISPCRGVFLYFPLLLAIPLAMGGAAHTCGRPPSRGLSQCASWSS